MSSIIGYTHSDIDRLQRILRIPLSPKTRYDLLDREIEELEVVKYFGNVGFVCFTFKEQQGRISVKIPYNIMERISFENQKFKINSLNDISFAMDLLYDL